MFGQAASLVRDMAGTYDADNARYVPQPMPDCTGYATQQYDELMFGM